MQQISVLIHNLSKSEFDTLRKSLNPFLTLYISKYKVWSILTPDDVFNEALCRILKSETSLENGSVKAFLKGTCFKVIQENARKIERFPAIKDSSIILDTLTSKQSVASQEEKELVEKICIGLKKEELELIYRKEVLGMTWDQVVNNSGAVLTVNSAKKKAQKFN
jgi:hypothetical protein